MTSLKRVNCVDSVDPSRRRQTMEPRARPDRCAGRVMDSTDSEPSIYGRESVLSSASKSGLDIVEANEMEDSRKTRRPSIINKVASSGRGGVVIELTKGRSVDHSSPPPRPDTLPDSSVIGLSVAERWTESDRRLGGDVGGRLGVVCKPTRSMHCSRQSTC